MLHRVPALQKQITHLLFYCSTMSEVANEVLDTPEGVLICHISSVLEQFALRLSLMGDFPP